MTNDEPSERELHDIAKREILKGLTEALRERPRDYSMIGALAGAYATLVVNKPER